jgi:predicted anti-sigma-YlaC factor YlaD
MKRRIYFICIALFIIVVTYSCSLKKMAMNQVANALSAPGGGTVFTGDNDPELVGDALPFAIKMYESLLASIPHHRGLQLRTGTLYVMYAYAFLHSPAEMHKDDTKEEYEKKEFLMQRAKNLYLRGRDILLNALDKKYPGFSIKIKGKQYEDAVKPISIDDIDFLFWAGTGWLGAFTIDPMDMDLAVTWPRAKALIDKTRELDENYMNGAIHEFYIAYYGSRPEGNFKLAREHFQKALELSGGKSGSPYIALATTAAVRENNPEEFKKLLNKALEIEPEADSENRLMNTLNRRKALWLLSHLEDFFLLETEEEE